MELFNLPYLASQVFWTAIALGILLLIMWKYVVPSITSTLDARADRIRADLTEAEEARVKSEELMAEYRKQLAAAKDEAKEMVAKARAEAQALTNQRMQELEAELARKNKSAQAQLTAAKDQAKAELREEVAALVVEVTGKVLQSQLDAKQVKAETSKVIKQLNS